MSKFMGSLFFSSLLFITGILISGMAQASDLAKEERWAEQVVDAVLDGDVIWLNDGKGDFLSIYTEAEQISNRSVIIMHGTGIHPDWQQVIQPLRIGLVQHGWNTLSIQMPVLANDADYIDYAPLYDEVAPRINAAMHYLEEQGASITVLVGHSQGSAMAAYYLSTIKRMPDGFVAIGLPVFDKDARMNSLLALEKITLPILDLYGEEDLDGIRATTRLRANAAKKAGNKQYTQIRIAGNHFFDGHEVELVKTVADWLNTIK